MIAPRLSEAKASATHAFFDQGRELGERRRSDTSVFPTVNDADPRRAWTHDLIFILICPRAALPSNPECSGHGGSMVARLKLKGIDGRAPQSAWSLRLNWIQRRAPYQAQTRRGLTD